MTDTFEEMTSGPDISHAPVESWTLNRIKPYPENNKKHSAAQIKELVKSIESQGLNDPITVDKKGVIISGHGRFEAIKVLGWKVCPVRHLKMLTPVQADKLRIAANKTSSNEYDYDAMQRELSRLSGMGESLDDMGFDAKELEMMVGSIGELDMDSISDDIITAVGDFEDEAREEAAKIGDEEVSLSKAFGLSKIPLRSMRTAKVFMGAIERETGLVGSDALVKFMEGYTT
jgi:ParB-like chromosome segregation protein Spo0J